MYKAIGNRDKADIESKYKIKIIKTIPPAKTKISLLIFNSISLRSRINLYIIKHETPNEIQLIIETAFNAYSKPETLKKQ